MSAKLFMNRTFWAGLLSLALNLSASAALYPYTLGNIHDVSVPASATTISYTSDGGRLASFNGQNPNETWTLLFADMANESGTSLSNLVSPSLEIAAVPEPVNVALGGFAGLLTLVAVFRTRPVRRRIRRWRAAFVEWVDAV